MKQRIITAIVMTIVFVPFILLGGYYLKVGMALLSIMAIKELWDLKKDHKEYPLLIKMFSIIGLLIMFFFNNSTNGISYVSLILTMMLLFLPSIFYKGKYSTKDAVYLLGYVIFLGIGFNTFSLVRNQSLWILIYLILVSTLNEIFALFTGMLFGKHKLIPSVSPNKTVEGVIGGLCVGALLSIIYYNFVIGQVSWIVILMTFILGIVGQLGDLLFSKIKRENGIKDFSNLMPGHGGILDRFDSIIWVVLLYLVCSLII